VLGAPSAAGATLEPRAGTTGRRHLDGSRRDESRRVLLHAAPLDGIRERAPRRRDGRRTGAHDLVDAPRLCEEREQGRLAPCDDGREPVEPATKASRPSARRVVEGGVPPRGEAPDHGQRALEVVQRRPGVAIVRAEAGEVDVAEVEHVVRLDVEHRVPPRVSRSVDGADRDAAQIEEVAISDRLSVGTLREVEPLDDDAREVVACQSVEAVDRHQAIERHHPRQIASGRAPGRVGIQVVPATWSS
jgi:hypothetical protein